MSRKRFTKLLVMATQGSMANTRSVETQNGGPAGRQSYSPAETRCL